MGEWAFELEICEPRTLAFNYCAWGEGVAETESGERETIHIFLSMYIVHVHVRVCLCVDVCLCTRFSVCTSGERPRALRPAQREKGDAAGQDSGSVTEICLSSPQTVQLKKSQSPLVHYYQLGFYTHLFTGLIYEPLS